MPDRPTRPLDRLLHLAALTTAAVGLLALLREPKQETSGRDQPRTGPSGPSPVEGFEVEDFSVPAVVKVLAVLALTTVVVIGIVALMGWRFSVAWYASNAALTPEQTAQMEPPAPHLQVNPLDDLARVEAHENRMLNSYGWTDPGHTLARIPIQRALALSVGKSLDAGP